MLSRIPSIHPKGTNSFFASNESRIFLYEILKDAPALLELAIWKSKMTEQHGQDDDIVLAKTKKKRRIGSVSKEQSRTDSVTMVIIIVPIVSSFLTDDNDDNDSV
jgi:hypothetical protein